MIYMEPRHWKMVEEILAKYPYTFYAYGSRTKGTQKRLSNLNLCFQDPIPFNVQGHIDADFEESDLPFIVDVMDWRFIDSELQEIIEKDLIPIKKEPNHAH